LAACPKKAVKTKHPNTAAMVIKMADSKDSGMVMGANGAKTPMQIGIQR
jgi:hypothetical protein